MVIKNMSEAQIPVLLYYKYVNIPDPIAEVELQRVFCLENNITGRILIGNEGINGTIAGEPESTNKYQDWMKARKIFNGIEFKISEGPKDTFGKLKIKFRPEIVTLGVEGLDPTKSGKRMTADELHQLIEQRDENVVLVDMRNDYESAIGRFEGAVEAPIHRFRELPNVIDTLKRYKNKKVVTYCTGGIRCEKASALLIKEGFTDVYQLDGGIFKYAEKYPDGYFEGKCFVFDKRMAIGFNKAKKSKILTNCKLCGNHSDNYVDCANKSCHDLFICCGDCMEKYKEYCSEECRVKCQN